MAKTTRPARDAQGGTVLAGANGSALTIGVALAAGLTMGAAGSYLTLTGTHVKVGTILTAIGPFLISWLVSSWFAGRAAKVEMQNQLAIVAQTLSQVTGRAARALREYESGDIDASQFAQSVGHSNFFYQGQTDQLIRLTGRGIDNKTLAVNVGAMENADSILAGVAGKLQQRPRTGELDTLAEQINQVREILDAETAKQEVSVKCPSCEREVSALIEPEPGRTTSVRCPFCGNRLNVHRNGAGHPIARAAVRSNYPATSGVRPGTADRVGEGTAVTSAPGSIKCLACGEPFFTKRRPVTGSALMVCLSCGVSTRIFPAAADDMQGAQFSKVSAEIVGGARSWPHLKCDVCGASKWSPLWNREGRFAYCVGDERLLFASHASLGEYFAPESGRP